MGNILKKTVSKHYVRIAYLQVKITFWLECATPSFIHSTVGVGTPEAVQVSVAFSPSFTITSGIDEICGRTEMIFKLEFLNGSTY